MAVLFFLKPATPVQFLYGLESSGGRKLLCLHSCRWALRLHLLHTVACAHLILLKTLLKGLKGLHTGLADLTDNRVVRGASSNAHLEVVTVPLPGLGLGGHTFPILVQLLAAVAGSDFQHCLHVEAGTRRFEVTFCSDSSQDPHFDFSFYSIACKCHCSARFHLLRETFVS